MGQELILADFSSRFASYIITAAHYEAMLIKIDLQRYGSIQLHTLKVASSILARCIDAAAGHHGIW